MKVDMTSFFCGGRSNEDEIWQTGADADCGDMVEMETET